MSHGNAQPRPDLSPRERALLLRLLAGHAGRALGDPALADRCLVGWEALGEGSPLDVTPASEAGAAEVLRLKLSCPDVGAYVEARRAVSPRLSQEALAREVGMRRETVCRAWPRRRPRGILAGGGER